MSVENHRMERSFRQRPVSSSKRSSRSRSPIRSTPNLHRIMISNLPYSVTAETVAELIRGETGFLGRVELLHKDGKPSGKAFVELGSHEMCNQVIELLHGCFLDERELVIRHEHMHASRQLTPEQEDLVHLMNYMSVLVLEKLEMPNRLTNSIHVGNLHFTVAWQDLKDLFRLTGYVYNVNVKLDPEGQSRGFAYVTFPHAFSAVQAVCMLDGQHFCGRDLRVRLDREGPIPPAIPKHKLPLIEARARKLLPYLLDQVTSGKTLDVKRLVVEMNLRAYPANIEKVAKGFGILGYPLRDLDEVQTWIQKLTHIKPPAEMPMRAPSQSDFNERMRERHSSPREVHHSRERNDPPFSNRVTSLRRLISAAMAGGMREDEVLEAIADITGSQDRHSESSGRRSDNRNERRSFQRSSQRDYMNRADGDDLKLNHNGERDCVVLVKNLPSYYSCHRLAQLFRPIGHVQRAEVITDANKQCRGFGYTFFDNHEAAEEAVEKFNGVLVGDNEIHVELA